MATTGTPAIEDVIVAIGGHPKLTSRTKSDLRSALRTIAKASGQPPNSIPANPPAISRRLKTFKPAELGIRPATWSNALNLGRRRHAV
jgi:hypothetical protein